MSWQRRPMLIENWDEDIDTIMAIDETGTTDLKYVEKKLRDLLIKTEAPERWFTITGAVFQRGEFESFRDKINSIKFNYWQDGLYHYKNGIQRVVFHSYEIRKRVGPFNPSLIKYSDFINDLSELMGTVPYTVYSSSIDKLEHIMKYRDPFHVYNLCLEFIIERYCRYLRANGKTGILLLESRGKKEDKDILKYLVRFLKNGNRYWTCNELSCIKGVFFNPKWSEASKKRSSYIHLEMADLISQPINKFVRTGNKDLAYITLEKNIQNYPNIDGYGLKIFP